MMEFVAVVIVSIVIAVLVVASIFIFGGNAFTGFQDPHQGEKDEKENHGL